MAVAARPRACSSACGSARRNTSRDCGRSCSSKIHGLKSPCERRALLFDPQILTALADLRDLMTTNIFANLGNRVLSGPFKGMEIPGQSPWNDTNQTCKLF